MDIRENMWLRDALEKVLDRHGMAGHNPTWTGGDPPSHDLLQDLVDATLSAYVLDAKKAETVAAILQDDMDMTPDSDYVDEVLNDAARNLTVSDLRDAMNAAGLAELDEDALKELLYAVQGMVKDVDISPPAWAPDMSGIVEEVLQVFK